MFSNNRESDSIQLLVNLVNIKDTRMQNKKEKKFFFLVTIKVCQNVNDALSICPVFI